MKFTLLLLSSIFLMSCNDDDITSMEESVTEEEVSFFNLKVGNTWSYEYFRREQFNDPLSNFISTGTTEIREVIEESVINDETVYTIQVISDFGEDDFLSEFDEELVTFQVKDSLGYLVRLNRGITFSSENQEEYLITSQGFGDIFGVLLDSSQTVETPVGTFDAKVNERFAVLQDGELSPGGDQQLVVDQLGEVLSRFSTVNQPIHIVERRLTSFNFPEE